MMEEKKISNIAKLIVYALSTLFIDIALHPLHLAQSRYILQDRRKAFSTYNNIFELWTSTLKSRSFFAGILGHLPINMFILGCYVLPSNSNLTEILTVGYLPILLTHPLLTVMRRIECQSNDKGMLPYKYKGYMNAFATIFREEGFKAFYRGFGANFVLVTLLSGINMISLDSSTD